MARIHGIGEIYYSPLSVQEEGWCSFRLDISPGLVTISDRLQEYLNKHGEVVCENMLLHDLLRVSNDGEPDEQDDLRFSGGACYPSDHFTDYGADLSPFYKHMTGLNSVVAPSEETEIDSAEYLGICLLLRLPCRLYHALIILSSKEQEIWVSVKQANEILPTGSVCLLVRVSEPVINLDRFLHALVRRMNRTAKVRQ